MKYIIGIDQSTQGSKAVLFDETGNFIDRADMAHKQLVNDKGWVSHDLSEIYANVLETVHLLVDKTGIDKSDITAVGISNQRETTAMWNHLGEPLADAIVWQCSRAEQIVKRYYDYKDIVYEKTGIPLSPYFPAMKMKWLLENTEHGKDYLLGTIDSWLIYKLTEGTSFATDYSNASRTQLFNLKTLSWDEELCSLFGIPVQALPEVCDSNSCFGFTDFDGYLEHKIPIHAAMGDSHAALFGQGCHQEGMVKATYGTGSSIMMNTGKNCVKSQHGLATSLAWGMNGYVEYVLEGNINYAGAVITWLQQDMHMIESAKEVEACVMAANPQDTTVLVPAFSGLGAPYWNDSAKAMLYGMSRTTGQPEIVKAAVESIAFQVSDVLKAMRRDSGEVIKELRVDGGPTKNRYLMQFESDIARQKICVSKQEELSAIGVAYMAGIAAGVYDKDKVFSNISYEIYEAKMEAKECQSKSSLWEDAIAMVLR